MAVVVTGASGFIGRNLVARLVELGIETVAVSRRPAAPQPGVRTVATADYADAPGGPADVLMHLAESPYAAAADGAAPELLRALAHRPFGRIVYVSSGLVYGDRTAAPRRPGDPASANGPYAQSKLAAEAVALERGGVVARLGNVIGPGMHEGTVISDILAQLDARGPVALRDLGPARDYVWVGDVAAALAAMAVGRASGVFNVGSGRSVTVAELARRILVLAGQPDRAVVGRLPASRSTLAFDIAETEAAFGWRPQVSLDEGLARLLESRRTALGGERAAR